MGSFPTKMVLCAEAGQGESREASSEQGGKRATTAPGSAPAPPTRSQPTRRGVALAAGARAHRRHPRSCPHRLRRLRQRAPPGSSQAPLLTSEGHRPFLARPFFPQSRGRACGTRSARGRGGAGGDTDAPAKPWGALPWGERAGCWVCRGTAASPQPPSPRSRPSSGPLRGCNRRSRKQAGNAVPGLSGSSGPLRGLSGEDLSPPLSRRGWRRNNEQLPARRFWDTLTMTLPKASDQTRSKPHESKRRLHGAASVFGTTPQPPIRTAPS